MTHSPLPKSFSLKITIVIYSSKNLRHLEEREIVVTTNEDSDGSENKMLTFSSDSLEGQISDTDEIRITDMKTNDNDNDYTTKAVTDNNICSLNFDKDSDLLDTGKVSSMIQAKKIPDCSLSSDIDLVSLNMDKIDGCDFTLNSETPVSFNNDNLDIELVSSENKDNMITANCDTKEDQIKSIQCKINDNVNNDYSLKNDLISESDKFIIISTKDDNDKFKISCENKENKNLLIIIIAGSLIILLTIIIISCCIYQKRKKMMNENIQKLENQLKMEKVVVATKRQLGYKDNDENINSMLQLANNTNANKMNIKNPDDEKKSKKSKKKKKKKDINQIYTDK